MNKLFTALVAGSFAVSVFAVEPPVTTERQTALEQWQNALPDSIRTRIGEHQQQITEFRTQMETQQFAFRERITAEKEAFRTRIHNFTNTLPDSLKNSIDVEHINIPDSIKVRIEAFKIERQAKVDSLKATIEQRRATAKADIRNELAKLDVEKKLKYEKALVQLEDRLADRQLRALDAQKQLEAKKAEILAKIENEKASKQ